MNNKLLYSPIVLLIIMFSNVVKAEETNNFTFPPCDSTQYLNCLNVSKRICIDSATEARKACYDNVNLFDKDDNINDSFIKEASSCFTSKYQKGLGVTNKGINNCDSVLSESMKPYIEAAKQQKALSDKRFFEDEQ